MKQGDKTCHARNDSLGIEISEEQTVDDCRLAETRLTYITTAASKTTQSIDDVVAVQMSTAASA